MRGTTLKDFIPIFIILLDLITENMKKMECTKTKMKKKNEKKKDKYNTIKTLLYYLR